MNNELDKTTIVIRFLCGFLFGFFGSVGFFFLELFRMNNLTNPTIACLMFGILTGYLAVRYGDEFWDSAKDWFR